MTFNALSILLNFCIINNNEKNFKGFFIITKIFLILLKLQATLIYNEFFKNNINKLQFIIKNSTLRKLVSRSEPTNLPKLTILCLGRTQIA